MLSFVMEKIEEEEEAPYNPDPLVSERRFTKGQSAYSQVLIYKADAFSSQGKRGDVSYPMKRLIILPSENVDLWWT